MTPLVIQVSQPEVTETSGMGRVAWHWQREFERRGYEFLNIGQTQVGPLRHPSLFPYAAYRHFKSLNRKASALLVHEPASGLFANRVSATIVVSHGIERNRWNLALQKKNGDGKTIRLRSRLLFPLWRLRQCDIGLRKAAKLLVVNNEDAELVRTQYGRDQKDVHVYRNGIYPSALDQSIQPSRETRVLFVGAWVSTKGKNTLVDAATILNNRGYEIHWLLAGTRADSSTVLGDWPKQLHHLIENIAEFDQSAEESLLRRSNFFVLPSFCEGQPLSLLQAMATGRCCITTNCCGQRELIAHGVNGLLHEPGDAEGLALLIGRCIDDESLRAELGRAAKDSVADRNWSTVSAEVADFVETAIGQLRVGKKPE